MQRTLTLFLVAFLAYTPTLAQSNSRPCGLKITPCPIDQKCISDNPACTDMNRCLGYCRWENTYDSCGGHRRVPKYCDEWSECKDDPREPDSCGMACDIPGICIPKHQESCGDGGCSEGLFCYETTTVNEDGSPHEGTICL